MLGTGIHRSRVKKLLKLIESAFLPNMVGICNFYPQISFICGALLINMSRYSTRQPESLLSANGWVVRHAMLEKITERLRNGQLVRVDESSGVVEILE